MNHNGSGSNCPLCDRPLSHIEYALMSCHHCQLDFIWTDLDGMLLDVRKFGDKSDWPYKKIKNMGIKRLQHYRELAQGGQDG